MRTRHVGSCVSIDACQWSRRKGFKCSGKEACVGCSAWDYFVIKNAPKVAVEVAASAVFGRDTTELGYTEGQAWTVMHSTCSHTYKSKEQPDVSTLHTPSIDVILRSQMTSQCI